MSLNPEQLAAVQHRGAPLLVLAGAGTGKTRVITHRIASLLDDGIPAWRVLAVTFTNKAAGEMRERIAELCGDDHDIKGLWVGTFHKICARILRRYGEPVDLSPNFSIYDPADQKSLMKEVMRELRVSETNFRPRLFLGYLDKLKNAGKPITRLSLTQIGLADPVLTTASNVLRRYQSRLRAADAVDFGDLLVRAVELLERAGPQPEPVVQPPAPASEFGQLFPFQGQPHGRLRYRKSGAPKDTQPSGQLTDVDPVVKLRRRFLQVLVDEYQDTNPVQVRLVRALSDNAEVCVVGDDDQAIYGWRGADVTQILSFPERHPGSRLIRLEQNYRSTSHILECAFEIIRRNLGRHGKKLWSDLGEGEPVRILSVYDEREESRWVANDIVDYLQNGGAPGDIAIFYRTHAQSRAIEEALRLSGLHYNVFGGQRFFDRKEIKDLVAYLRLLINRRSDVDFLRVANTPARKIGKTTLARLSEYASENGLSLWDAVPSATAAGIKSAAKRRLEGFCALIDELDAGLSAHRDLGRVAGEILERTGYRHMLAGEGSDEAKTRLENLQEFVGELEAYCEEVPGAGLADYLEQVSLASDADGVDQRGSLTMMTIHSAKGLEFQRVYLTGMEEGVFPHARALDEAESNQGDPIEEERRLAYVAVTRAKRVLTISWARARRLYGLQKIREPSRFLGNLPREHVELIGRRGAVSQARPPSQIPTRGPARRQHWDSDIEYDEPASHSAPDEGVAVYIGMQVRHKKFGVGEVVGWNGGGQNLKLVLNFPGHGAKTIIARFCEPV